MKKRKTFIAMALIIAVLVLGVGYAAINNINLNINGTANITANADFDVAFDTSHTPSVVNASASYTNATNATVTVDLDSEKTTATAILKVDNNSTELSANLVATVGEVDVDLEKYAEITTELCSDAACGTALTGVVTKETSAYVKVTANLKKNPAQDVKNKTFSVSLVASPVDAN